MLVLRDVIVYDDEVAPDIGESLEHVVELPEYHW